MSRPSFDQSFKKHLANEQRREVMSTLRATLRRETTLGEIVDAAVKVGWSEAMGELTLADLARALVVEDGSDASSPKPAVTRRSPGATSSLPREELAPSAPVEATATAKAKSQVESPPPRGRTKAAPTTRTQRQLALSIPAASEASSGDDTGHGARAKTTTKKTARVAAPAEPKKAAPKKAAPKKAEPKKAAPKKAEPKKAAGVKTSATRGPGRGSAAAKPAKRTARR